MISGCSIEDLESLKNMSKNSSIQTVYIPNGSSLKNQNFATPSDNNVSAIFMGSGHPPNENAANFIVTEIAPKCPSVQFHIVGSCMPKSEFDNVICHGFLEEKELLNVISNCSLALNPMEEGSGSNVKVFSYWRHKIPVLSTSFGMRGIECVDTCYINSSLSDFAETINSSIGNPNLLSKVKENAYQEFISNYTWEKIALKFDESIRKLVNTQISVDSSTVLFLNDYNSFTNIVEDA